MPESTSGPYGEYRLPSYPPPPRPVPPVRFEPGEVAALIAAMSGTSPPRPDVPDDLMDLACARFTDRPVEPGVEWIPMRRTLAAVIPEIERRALRNAADALLTTGAHSDLCQLGPPGTCDCALGEHYRWLITRSEGETHDAP